MIEEMPHASGFVLDPFIRLLREYNARSTVGNKSKTSRSLSLHSILVTRSHLGRFREDVWFYMLVVPVTYNPARQTNPLRAKMNEQGDVSCYDSDCSLELHVIAYCAPPDESAARCRGTGSEMPRDWAAFEVDVFIRTPA